MNVEDQLAALRGDAPRRVRDGALLATGLVDGFTVMDSPLGEIVVAFNPAGVSAVDLHTERFEERFAHRHGRRLLAARPPSGWDVLIGRAVERGRPAELPLDLRSVTAFQRVVLVRAAAIPRGEVRPYGWLAKEVDRPRAVRAVGTTMARNPVPLIVPCHRVVRSDGRIGAYSLGGSDNKVSLLEHEGVGPTRLEAFASRRVRLLGSAATRVFCLPTCRVARQVPPAHLVELRDAHTAEQAGFSPCRVCRPV